MTSCEHLRWPVSRINVKNNTILRKPFTNGLRSFWTSKGVFQHQDFFSARKWCFLSTRISRHPQFAQSQMRRCAFHYNVVPKNAWIFLRTWNVLRWKKKCVLLHLYDKVDRHEIKFAFRYSLGNRSRIFSKRVAFRNTLLIANQANSKHASNQCRPCPYVPNAMICDDV